MLHALCRVRQVCGALNAPAVHAETGRGTSVKVIPYAKYPYGPISSKYTNYVKHSY